jgi:peroxiredoxin
MLATMKCILPSLLAALCLPALGVAQRTLAEVQQQFVLESQRLGPDASRAQRTELLQKHIGQLGTFVETEAKGDDRWNGRLMLADLNLASGDKKAGAKALQSIDPKEAPALLLVTAASMAQHLGLTDQRDSWIRAALGKEAPLADRLAMGRMLMTVLHEIERGEGLFAAALAAAGTDEDKALVRWHRADAMRDREDLPDNAGFEELEKLANDLPKTYWGSVAKDRLRRTRLQVGDDAIAFRATTRSHGDVSSEALLGKAVVLVFWVSGDQDTPRLLEVLRQLQTRCGDKLAIVGVNLDRDEATIAAAIKDLGIDFPVVGDGKGILHDVALRWFAEGPVVHVIDGKGKVAGLGLHAGTADGRAELLETVERAAGS